MSLEAAAYPIPPEVEGTGYGAGVYLGDGRYRLYEYPRPIPSAVYNTRLGGSQAGRNPYYLTGFDASYRTDRWVSHIRRLDALSNTIYKNPELLRPRMSTNTQRALRGFNEGFFTFFGRPTVVTGTVFRTTPGVFD